MRLLGSCLLGFVLALAAGTGAAAEDSLRFPGDPASHRLVYQLNRGEPEYQTAVFNSVRAVLQKYGDDVDVAVVVIGPAIHVLAKEPRQPVPEELRQRAESFAFYGVEFFACGNTLSSLGWTEVDVRPFAEVAEVGAAKLMELQEQGYAYIAW